MCSFCDMFCDYCCFCCPKKFEKTEYKRNKKLNELDSMTPSKKSGVWSTASNPLNVKTEDISDFYKIPNKEFKTEEDLIKSLGYKINSFIDSGAFASVWSATHLSSGVEIAVKKVEIPEELDERTAKKRKNLFKDIKNELYAMQNVRHRHIIKLINHFVIVCPEKTTLYILMQLAKGGTLSKMCDQFGPFSENTCKIWFAQMLSALSHVHSKGMAHRDLKLSNILLDENRDVLISDFGMSRLVWRPSPNQILISKTFCGTPPYMSPELLMQYKPESELKVGYNALAVDVWALGVILYKLFNKEYPFPQNRRKAIKAMNQNHWKFSKYTVSQPSADLKDILNKMFEPNPKKRNKIDDLKNHKWIQKMFEDIEQKSLKLEDINKGPPNQ